MDADGFEEPADIGEFLGTAPLAAYPSAAIADDSVAADQLLARALGVRASLAADLMQAHTCTGTSDLGSVTR